MRNECERKIKINCTNRKACLFWFPFWVHFGWPEASSSTIRRSRRTFAITFLTKDCGGLVLCNPSSRGRYHVRKCVLPRCSSAAHPSLPYPALPLYPATVRRSSLGAVPVARLGLARVCARCACPRRPDPACYASLSRPDPACYASLVGLASRPARLRQGLGWRGGASYCLKDGDGRDVINAS